MVFEPYGCAVAGQTLQFMIERGLADLPFDDAVCGKELPTSAAQFGGCKSCKGGLV